MYNVVKKNKTIILIYCSCWQLHFLHLIPEAYHVKTNEIVIYNFDDFLKIEFLELEGQKYNQITTIDWTLQSYDQILGPSLVEEAIVDNMTNLGSCPGFWTKTFDDFLKIEFSEL